MRQAALNKRQLEAQERIVAVTEDLIERAPLSDDEKATLREQLDPLGHHDARVRRVWRIEGIADVLEVVSELFQPVGAGATGVIEWTEQDDERLLEISGIGPKTLEEIKTALLDAE